MLIGSLWKRWLAVHQHFRTSFPSVKLSLGGSYHISNYSRYGYMVCSSCVLFLSQNLKEAHVSSPSLSGGKLHAALRGHWIWSLNHHIVQCHLPFRRPTLGHLFSHHYPYWYTVFLCEIHDSVFSSFSIELFLFYLLHYWKILPFFFTIYQKIIQS